MTSPTAPPAPPTSRPLVLGFVFALALGACKKDETTTVPEPDEDPVVEVEAPPIKPLDKRVTAAEKLVGEGQVQEALDAMDLALVDEPNHADLHYGRGVALSFLDRDDDSLAAYEKALELDAGHVPALVAHGNLIGFGYGDLDKAAADFERATELAPKFPPAFHGLGVVRFDQGKVEAAVAALERAAELDPSSVDSHFVLAQAYAALERTEEAITAASAAIELEPGASGADLRLVRARLLTAASRTTDAVEEYEALSALVPENYEMRLAIVRGLIQAGAPDKAVAEAEAVANALPESPVPLVNWGRALAATDDIPGALEKFAAALELDANNPAAHVHTVETLVASGDCKKAKRAVKAFSATGPKPELLERATAAAEGCTAA